MILNESNCNMPTKKSPKITIIGGGILGLTLAYLLAKQQYNVRIIEKNKDLGGLASAFAISDEYLERYYHHFFKSDKHLQGLLSELGIADLIEWLPSKMGLYDGQRFYPFSHALDILKFPALNIIDRLRLGLISFFLQKKKPDPNFSKITALEWCNKYYGRNVTTKIWEPLLKSKFEDYYDKVSMDWFHIRIHDRSSSRTLPFKDETLGYIKGSFNTLINKLEDKLNELKVEIFKESYVENYSYVKNKHLIKMAGRYKKSLESDIVVANIPPQLFNSIFKPARSYSQKLNNIKFLAAYCFVLELDSPLSKYYWTSVNDPKAPFVALVEHTNLVSSANFKGNSIIYLGKYTNSNSKLFSMDEGQLFDVCLNYLKKIYPDLKPENIKSRYLFRAPQAQHIVTSNYSVLSYETGRKGLLYAHFSQIYPHDRGTNYAIAQAYELFNLISSRKWN